ncbi:hypothetical protein INR49_017309, partial [Caranx melampygus]
FHQLNEPPLRQEECLLKSVQEPDDSLLLCHSACNRVMRLEKTSERSHRGARFPQQEGRRYRGFDELSFGRPVLGSRRRAELRAPDFVEAAVLWPELRLPGSTSSNDRVMLNSERRCCLGLYLLDNFGSTFTHGAILDRHYIAADEVKAEEQSSR